MIWGVGGGASGERRRSQSMSSLVSYSFTAIPPREPEPCKVRLCAKATNRRVTRSHHLPASKLGYLLALTSFDSHPLSTTTPLKLPLQRSIRLSTVNVSDPHFPPCPLPQRAPAKPPKPSSPIRPRLMRSKNPKSPQRPWKRMTSLRISRSRVGLVLSLKLQDTLPSVSFDGIRLIADVFFSPLNLDWPPEDAEGPGERGNTHLWEESWDDDDTSEDFSKQLK